MRPTLRRHPARHIGALPRLFVLRIGDSPRPAQGAARKAFRGGVCDDWHMPLRLVLWPAGLALGAYSLALARDDPFSFAGTSLGGAVALLGAGWALLACAVIFLGRHPGNLVGPLLAAASGA